MKGTPSIDGVLVVDKPHGPTSHDIVSRARRAFGTRSVGHAGTLDPAATGVLVLGIGQGTKLLSYLTSDDKEYETEIALGAETDTLDAAGKVIERAPLLDLEHADVRETARRFVGTIRQRAPVVSAIKVGGRALYERVRRGEKVEAPVREVVVHDIELLEVEPSRIRLRVACGKGFYVRSLARDLGRALGTLGHVASLRRLRSGAFGLDQAVPYPMLDAAAKDSLSRAELIAQTLTLTAAWSPRPTVVLTAEGLDDARHGRRVSASRVVGGLPSGPDGEAFGMLDAEDRLVALARRDSDELKIARGIVRAPK